MLIGEVRALASWLNANAQEPENGSAGDGTWGNMADPSAEFIRYLSQGGDPAQVWCAAILTDPAVNNALPALTEASVN